MYGECGWKTGYDGEFGEAALDLPSRIIAGGGSTFLFFGAFQNADVWVDSG